MNARDVMSKDPACCTEDTSLQMVAQMMVDHDCGEIPVVENEDNLKLIGVITDRDIVCRAVAKARNPLEMNAGAVMSHDIVSVNPESSIEECIHLMQQHQIRRLPVVDKNGSCIGMVAQADLARRDESHAKEVVKEVSKSRTRR